MINGILNSCEKSLINKLIVLLTDIKIDSFVFFDLNMMPKKILHKALPLIFIFQSFIIFSQPHGKLLISNFDQLQIGSESGAFWSVVKDKRGVLYFGGEGKIFEYDGMSWRGINIPNLSVVRSLAIDTNGTIYVGAVSEFGYLQPDNTGKLCYVSLLPLVPKNKLSFPDVWTINILNEAVYFQSANRLFRLDNGKITSWELQNSYHRAFIFNNTLLFNQRDIGLCRLINDSIQLIPQGEFFREMVISSITSFEDDKMLIGSRNNGLFIYNPISESAATIEPMPCEAGSFLKDNQIYHGINLPNNRQAFASLHGGVIIVDERGNIVNFINKSTGFIDYTAYYIDLINNNELWITSTKGVSFYNINSPISYWNDELGVIGAVNNVLQHNNKIFVATLSGLFYHDLAIPVDNKLKYNPNSFKTYNNLNTEVWDIIKFDPSGKFQDPARIQILAAAGIGLYNVEQKTVVFPNEGNGQITFCQSKKCPSILYFNTHPTFYILQFVDNKWHVLWAKNISSYIASIVEDNYGNVWIGTKFYGVFKLELSSFLKKHSSDFIQLLPSEQLKNLNVEHFNTVSGLPNLNTCVAHTYKNNLIISCDGLFDFNEKNKRFERTKIFGEEIKVWNKTINAFKEDITGNIWGHESEVFAKQPDGGFKITRLPYRILTVRNSTLNYYHDNKGCTWIGGEQGLIRYDSRATHPNNEYEFSTLIRKVSIDFDSVIFFGTNFSKEINKMFVNLFQPQELIPTLNVKNKSISFEFACPYFQDDMPLEYSYILEGYDTEWSEWSKNLKKEYNNLRENKYIFKVRARNYAGELSREASYKFIITPPWYRTVLAYIMYLLSFLYTIYLSIKIYSNRLRQYNLHLEKTVKERTLILEKQKEEINLQAEKLKIQNEKLSHQKNRMSEMSKEIAETNKNKMHFFTNISHELRTPLTLIIGPVEELLNDKKHLSESEKKNIFSLIHRNASRLLTLVNQILDFRKLEIQTPKLAASENDIVRFTEDIAAYFKDLAQNKNIDFIFSSTESKITFWFDRDKVEKIIYNLISNAFKYTPEGGRITINISMAENFAFDGFNSKAVKVSIIDTGIGISEETLPQIFDRYFQSGRSLSLNQAGSGIGLSMAAKFTEIHRGKITIESQINKGSTFTLILPFEKDYLKNDELADSSNIVKDESYIETRLAEFKHINSSNKETTNRIEIDEEKFTILIVEDSDDIRFFIKSSLQKKYNFIEAEDGLQGLKIAEEYSPDLIITDIMMPNMDGYEFCSKIKTTLETSHIPVIMLTSKSGISDQKLGLEVGADDYISKPFNINLLEIRIDNLIKTRTDLRDRFSKEVVLKPTDLVLTSTDEKFLNKAMKIVEEHISEPNYDIDTFSRDMAMSQSTLYRKLKALTGESTNNFIKDLRLNRAASLLSQNEISVSEIANMVGFDDPAYFSKSFKQKFGLSPSEYSKKFL